MKARILQNNDFGGEYSEKWLFDNNNLIFAGQLVSEWVLTEILPSENLVQPIWVSDKWVEKLTEQEIIALENQKKLDDEYFLYQKRILDGVNSYLKLSAEFRIAKLSGEINEQTHSYIEEVLTPVRNEVMFGQWKKALSILESIGNSQIGFELYNRIHTQISKYISENY